MPNYRYTCECGGEALRVRKVAERDEAIHCHICGNKMTREALGDPFVRADTNFKMQAITNDGKKIEGSFTGAKQRSWLSANAKRRR